jgi:hypothetical protein
LKKLLCFALLAALAIAPSAARSQPSMMSSSAYGAGPRGYDWLIGTWSCTNTMASASAMSGPASTTFTGSKSGSGGVMIRVSGKNFDETAYLAYLPKTKTWWGPFAFSDGSYEIETSTGTGRKITWTGTYTGASDGQTMKVRDLYTVFSATKQNDVGQYQSGGSWKNLYNINCTKS